jgi:hypothetical protein
MHGASRWSRVGVCFEGEEGESTNVRVLEGSIGRDGRDDPRKEGEG